jgi:predicted RNA-binding protein YlqC (UPF0109 family)
MMNTDQSNLDTDHEEDQPELDADEYSEDESEYAGNASDAAPDAATENMRDLVLFMASQLIEQPDDLDVQAERRGSAVHLRLRVPPEELGKVIGRQGRVARAMRTVLTIAGSRHNVRTSLDIED